MPTKYFNQSALITDVYQLTMLQSYFDNQMDETAVFEFYVRKLPSQRNFLLAAGLEQVLEYLENLHFSQDEIDYLSSTKRFSNDFLASLAQFKFTGTVNAMAEGTIFFPNEPIIQVIAPLSQAQLIESRVINILHLQSLIASKAARCVLQAPNKLLVDFGMRRAHGQEAALFASRANMIAGFSGTAGVHAGCEYDLPIYGTMAHSYIQAHDCELNAYLDFARSHPNNVVLLNDTYDVTQGTDHVIEAAKQLAKENIKIKAVRIDSGDLAAHAKAVRAQLDQAGFESIGIFVSGDLDEAKLQHLKQVNAPIDGFGIGTKLDTSNDQPYLDCAYKLQEYAGKPKRKHSAGKVTWPGRKQVYRYYDDKGLLQHDELCLANEERSNAQALLQTVMKGGQRCQAVKSILEIQKNVLEHYQQLPKPLTTLEKASSAYSVNISKELQALANTL